MSRVQQIAVGAVVVVVLSALGFWGYRSYLAPVSQTPTPVSQAAFGDAGPEVVSAEGRVIPAQSAALSFAGGGVVAEILVEEGQPVEAGEPLARLESYSQFEASVAAAEVGLISAQQAYDDLFENLDTSRALALKAVADARDAVREAERTLTNLENPAPQADIDQARSNLVLAEDRLDKAREDFAPYENRPESNLIRASLQSILAQAQKDYDAAVRLVNNLEGNADEIDVEQGQADLALAQAQLAQYERDYAALGDGPDSDTLELVAAQLDNAKAQLAAAQDALSQQELRAPFDGAVVDINLKVGEFIAPGLPAVVVADLTRWQIETTDLAESDVALLSSGLPATISLDAFPEEEFAGEVVRVGLLGEDVRGAITYPLLIDFDPGEAPVRWEMTAFVEIELPSSE
jgi:multidrug resistance efflux pump